ncbi:hypothetical protein GGF46_005310 [Coemansia sp. RSA 552]|nr:hypothetical protein GGF46_005310 [Coemansia sp. RSA 552]
MAELPHSLKLTVPFGEARLAEIAKTTLGVDAELSADKAQRTATAEGSNLVVQFQADSLRMLRVSVNGFMDSLILVTQTLEAYK